MGNKLSRAISSISISSCSLTLGDLVNIESELQNGIITAKSVSQLLTFVVKIENLQIKVCTRLESLKEFDIKSLPSHCVIIFKELNTSYVYSVVYKNKNGQLFYKNAEGTAPSVALSAKLDKDIELVVNTSCEGPEAGGQHWMAIQNAIVIASIANQSHDIYKFEQEAQRFCKRDKVGKYKATLLKQLHKRMLSKIDISEVKRILKSQHSSDLITDSVDWKAFIAVSKNAHSKVKKKLRHIDKHNLALETQFEKHLVIDNIVDVERSITLIKAEVLRLDPLDNDQIKRDWDSKTKGQLKKDWSKATARCVIALQRTMELTIRDNQLMAIVLFFLGDKHTFIEVAPGEGKTLIVAVVAAVEVLLGHKVDIITYDNLLATDNAKTMNKFYTALGMTCASNTDAQNGNPYLSDVVYGSMYQWRNDYLLNCLKETQRKHDCCILDEVDILELDIAQQQFVPKRNPFPGMRELRNIYRDIYYRKSDLQLDQYPTYLRPYCEFMIPIWEANRRNLDVNHRKEVQFIYDFHQVIMPIDNQNTGALIHKSVFSDGVQQFLQFEFEGYPGISAEILQPLSISNHGFVGLYQQRVFGVTGMLSPRKEDHEMLEKIFQKLVKFYKIPKTFEQRTFQEYDVTYTLEDGDEEVLELSRQIHDSSVFLGTHDEGHLKSRLVQAGNIARSDITWGFTPETIKCIKAGDFTINASCVDDGLLKHVNGNWAGMVVWDNDELLCCAKMVDKLIGQYGMPIHNKDAYIYKIEEELVNTLIVNDDDEDNVVVDELEMYGFNLNSDRKVFIFNRKFEDTCGPSTLFIEDVSFTNFAFFKQFYFNIKPNLEHGGVDITMHPIVLKMSAICNPLHQTLIKSIMQIVEQKRAVLVVCKDDMELEQLRRNILKAHLHDKVYFYDNVEELKDPNTIEPMDAFVTECGFIMLTTKMGARGAYYKTSAELESNGGLHVILTFLPETEKLHRQAFGRTARNGTCGSAQLVLKQIDVMTALQCDDLPPSGALLSLRRHEFNRTQRIDIQTDRFFDEISQLFIQFYKQKELEAGDNGGLRAILLDVQQCWTFWMKLQRFKSHKEEDVKLMKADDKFRLFLNDAEGVISGKGFFNPFYAVKRISYHFGAREHDEGQRLLQALVIQERISPNTQSEIGRLVRLILLKLIMDS